MPYLLKKQLKLLKYKNKIVKLIMVFSNCESKMGDFEPDVDIDEKQAGFKLDKDSVSQTVRGALARYRDGPHMNAIT